MNFLTLVTEVIQGCRVEALGVKVHGRGTLKSVWYYDGYIILSDSDTYPPFDKAVIVSPLPQDAGTRPRLNNL